MVVAFTGLGGSGKTTHIDLLRKAFPSARVIHYPDVLVLTPLLQKLLGKHNPSPESLDQELKPQNRWWVLLKAIIHWVDSWLVWVRYGRCGDNLIIFDRFWHDQLVYYYNVSANAQRVLDCLIKVFPRVDLIIHLWVSPEEALQRKREWPVETLWREAAMRERVLRGLQSITFTLDAMADIDTTNQALRELISLRLSGMEAEPTVLYLAALLDSQVRKALPALSRVLRPDPNALRMTAKRNRLLYPVSRLLPGRGLFPEDLLRARLQRYRNTVRKLAEISEAAGIPLLLLKDFHSYPIANVPSDVDIAVRRDDAEQLAAILEQFGPVRRTEAHKCEWRWEGGGPVDIYIGGIFDGCLKIVSEQALWPGASQREDGLLRPHPDAEALILMGHAIHETGLMLLRDLLQCRSLFNECDRSVILREAEQCGWGRLCKDWLYRVDSFYQSVQGKTDVRRSWKFPLPLSLPALTLAWWRMTFGGSGIRDLLAKLWQGMALTARALRMWRVRCKGRIPFHDFELGD